MLRRHPDIQPQTKSECGLGHIEARPAPILFKSAGALLALWYVLKRTAKVAIMKKMILAINPKARDPLQAVAACRRRAPRYLQA